MTLSYTVLWRRVLVLDVIAIAGGFVLRTIAGGVAAAGALFAYCIWAFELPVVDGIPWRPLTILPFAACLHRYGALVRDGDGEAPEEVLLADRRLQVAALGWLALFTLGVNAGG